MYMNTVVSAHEARKNLGELINQAYYQGRPFVLTRGKKPMAALIGANEFRLFIRFLEKHDPGLTDTLAITADPELEALLEEDAENIKKGKTIPMSEWLKDD